MVYGKAASIRPRPQPAAQQRQPAPPYAAAPYAPPPYVPQAAPGMPRRVVTREHKRTSHGLHLFLTIITGGAWGIFVWLPITLWHRSHKGEKIVTHYR